MTVGAMVGGAVLTYGNQNAWSRSSFVAAVAALWFGQLAAWSVWYMFVYPHYLSSLRHLPQPGGSHWLLGHGRKIAAEPNGQPAREW